MSDKKPSKKIETVRERAERLAKETAASTQKADKPKKRRFKLRRKVEKEGRKRRFHLIPKFIPESWKELRSVTWPDWKNTLKLTLAVILFSVVFGAVIGLIDFGLGKVFKKVFLHG